MKILIDENLPRKLAPHFGQHECRTVAECGWSGKKNGELLALADPLFDVLLTLDKNLPYQQNLDSVRIAVLIIHAYSNRIPDLLPRPVEPVSPGLSSNSPHATISRSHPAVPSHVSRCRFQIIDSMFHALFRVLGYPESVLELAGISVRTPFTRFPHPE